MHWREERLRSRRCTGQWNDGVEQQVRRKDYVSDAAAYALSYGRDFRALHQLSHDHDCRSTCVKYVKPKVKAAAEERVKRGLVVACRFFFYHILEFACSAVQPALRQGKKAIKRIRRKGKKLVDAAYVAWTNDRNEFGKVVVVRRTPFRSATTDVGQNWCRCNVDFQFMPRILDPDELLESAMPPDGVAQPAHQPQVVPQTDPKLALGMYGVRLQLPDSPLLRRCFHSIVAMHQAAHNCDYSRTRLAYKGSYSLS